MRPSFGQFWALPWICHWWANIWWHTSTKHFGGPSVSPTTSTTTLTFFGGRTTSCHGGVATYPFVGERGKAHGCVFHGRKMRGVATNVYWKELLKKLKYDKWKGNHQRWLCVSDSILKRVISHDSMGLERPNYLAYELNILNIIFLLYYLVIFSVP